MFFQTKKILWSWLVVKDQRHVETRIWKKKKKKKGSQDERKVIKTREKEDSEDLRILEILGGKTEYIYIYNTQTKNPITELDCLGKEKDPNFPKKVT